MPHPSVRDSDVRSPYDAGLSYFQDEYSNGDGGFGDASRLGFSITSLTDPVSLAGGLVSAVGTALGGQDAQRQARANSIRDLALKGSVLAAQIVLAGPNNVSNNEAHFWTDAATVIQQQRPDVWTEAVAAGPWWPVGADFNMTAARAQIAQQLASVGVTVSNATQAFGTVAGTATGSPIIAAQATGASLLSNPIIVLGGAGLVAFALSRRGKRR